MSWPIALEDSTPQYESNCGHIECIRLFLIYRVQGPFSGVVILLDSFAVSDIVSKCCNLESPLPN